VTGIFTFAIEILSKISFKYRTYFMHHGFKLNSPHLATFLLKDYMVQYFEQLKDCFV
jgi:hypothetical protein